jgi:enediyne biosynthesis protein E4
MTTLPRAHFLRLLAASLASAGTGLRALSSLAGLAPRIPPAEPLFEELPPSATGITWTHVNGRSPEYYLPETTGAGCAFLDYDNDGWMDIYLVNSGKCDFFSPDPPLRNALYKNNRDGTFTDVTEKAGVATAWVLPSAITMATASLIST